MLKKIRVRARILSGEVYRGVYIVDSQGKEAVYVWPEDVQGLIRQLRQFAAHRKLVLKKLNKRVWQTRTRITATTHLEVVTK